MQIHAMQQVFFCFSRLLKIADLSKEEGVVFPSIERAQWSRKVGDALYHLGKYRKAEEYLFMALNILSLDCRSVVQMEKGDSRVYHDNNQDSFPSETKKGCFSCLFKPKSDNFFAVPNTHASSANPKMSSLHEQSFPKQYESCHQSYEDVVRTPPRPSRLGSLHGATPIRSVHRLNTFKGLRQVILHGNAVAQDLLKKEAESNHNNSSTGHLSVRLINRFTKTSSQTSITDESHEGSCHSDMGCIPTHEQQRLLDFRASAQEVLLEASHIYELLGLLNENRRDNAALERRLNALTLAKTAVVPDSKSLPVELARAYAHCASFFAGMKSGSKWHQLAKQYNNHAMKLLELSEFDQEVPLDSYSHDKNSETSAIMNLRCGEYQAFVGNFQAADVRRVLLLLYSLYSQVHIFHALRNILICIGFKTNTHMYRHKDEHIHI